MNKQTLAREILANASWCPDYAVELAQLVLEEDNIPPINGILDESKTVYVGIDFAKDYLNEIRDDAKQEQKEKDAEIVASFDDGAGGGVDPQEIVKAIFDQQGQ